ncbi:MAG: hypothetical protein Q4G22_02870 [Paracoccus sp. (in: a-proteobacteria)]|nr:hypothetical protein [Paracoccus sp. (in: a-proteobacteria)]
MKAALCGGGMAITCNPLPVQAAAFAPCPASCTMTGIVSLGVAMFRRI